MKKQIRHLMLAVAIIALPVISQAQNADCDAIAGAARTGKTLANNRIQTAETNLKNSAARYRACMEQFADLAARASVVLGGFDMTPIRNFLSQKGCSMIESEIQQAIFQVQQQVAPINQQIGQVQQQIGQIQNGSIINQAIQPLTTLPGGSQVLPQVQNTLKNGQKSIWDRMTCTVNGTC